VLFNARIVARGLGRLHVVVLGDSHSEALKGWRSRRYWFSVTSIGGATASGIRNPNSETEALPRFRARLQDARPWQPVMVMLGEVDCGYIIFRRTATAGVTLEESFAETIRRYVDFLESEIAPCWRPIVMSVPLPALPDDSSQWGEVAQRRADVQVSQRDRTDMTLRFNDRMRCVCAERGWRFVDSTTGQIDPTTGLLRPDLVRDDGDHHLAQGPYRTLIREALLEK
jgi:hypothetical protein